MVIVPRLLGLAVCLSDEPVTASCPEDVGILCTWAGNGSAGFNGDGNTLLESTLYFPVDVLFTSGGDAYIVDWNNHAVRHVTSAGNLQTVIGDGFIGDGPPDQSDRQDPGAPGTTVSLNHPTDLIELPDGRLLLAAWQNHKLRRYDPATGLVRVICGDHAGFAGDNGPASSALLNEPSGAAISPDGTIYVLDQRNQRIRRISTDGNIMTVAGTGVAGYGGDGDDPLLARFRFPSGANPPPAGTIVLDGLGLLYISDTENHRIRRVDFAANVIQTVAGSGVPGYAGDGGPATAALINNPRDLEIGPDGKLYIADELNHVIRALDLSTGIITTVAGSGSPGFSGDEGNALGASLNHPTGIAFDGEGRMYITDSYNHRIRRVRLTFTTPVILSSFTVERRGRDAVLLWEVAEATDYAGFHVYRRLREERVKLTDQLLCCQRHYEFRDSLAPQGMAEYWLAELSRGWRMSWHGPITLSALPMAPRITLSLATPNPFRSSTTITYSIPDTRPVDLAVYDPLGRRVRNLVDEVQGPGGYAVAWDGATDRGEPAPRGLYIVRFTVGDERRSQKIVYTQ